ncbi:hypothetical protein ACFVTX_03260 [Agromyces sp. NPDC058136]|uniref:hypothetical protein n=1 Tax=Agromyces sp. NPDC058136 TaxID=3346354 RepID=UPI0036D7A157
MTGTLWQPTAEKLVLLFVLAAFALAVAMFVLVQRRRLVERVAPSGGVIPAHVASTILVLRAVMFSVAGVVLLVFAVLLGPGVFAG